MPTERRLTVREMGLDEVGIRVDYFHESSDDHLLRLGVDRSLLPTRQTWLAFYEEDFARPASDRESYALIWDLDGSIVGFSSVDHIVFGAEASMHLHILSPSCRRVGLGAEFVRLSAREYFRVLRLDRLFSEPNALNVAPNRTLQSAGFKYLLTHETTPGPINFPQITTRWILDQPG
jgi:RimJ/RimL family protein N-acetyltransferase